MFVAARQSATFLPSLPLGSLGLPLGLLRNDRANFFLLLHTQRIQKRQVFHGFRIRLFTFT